MQSPAYFAPANGIQLCYETFGEPSCPTVVLISGLGVQLLGWHEDLCADLAARGLYVIRFDNRDTGLSTHLDSKGTPDLAKLAAGEGVLPYELVELARDVAGLLDHLGVTQAHVVGASLGAAIAQLTALEFPDRVASLTCVMGTTGEASVSVPTPDALATLLRPSATDRAGYLAGALQSIRCFGSPAYPYDPTVVTERAGKAYDRNHDPAGRARQLAAFMADGDRTARLAAVTCPTLVVHGEADPLIPAPAGVAIARAITGARLVLIPGVGHELPRPIWPILVSGVCDLVAQGETSMERRNGTND